MNRADEALDWYRKNCTTFGHLSHPNQRARCILSAEYAKLRDETPITEEWAAKVRSERVRLDSRQYDDGIGWWFSICRFDGEFGEVSVPVAYCGQARCLLLAAGIECEV